jgi:hypothetical protein
MPADLLQIAANVIRRARRQGFVLPDEVREELRLAGAPESLWRDVLALARPALSQHPGRSLYLPVVEGRDEPGQAAEHGAPGAERGVPARPRPALTDPLTAGTVAPRQERREQDRIDFIQPVKVLVGDGKEYNVLSRDLSPSGIRLITTRSFLGLKIRVLIPGAQGRDPACFLVRILWTCAVGDDLFENGGMFLDSDPPPPPPVV